MKLCPKCGVNHNKLGFFCSRSCANSRQHSKETRKKQSLSVKTYYEKVGKDVCSEKSKKGHRYQCPYCKIKWLNCTNCNIEFWASPSKPQYTTCSEQCFLAVKRKNRAGNKIFYDGEWYDSGWEIEMVKWFRDRKISYTREITGIPWYDNNGKMHRYFPDFYIPSLDLYVDPKNKFCIKDQKEKIDAVQSKINLVYGEISYIQEKIMILQDRPIYSL